jgi:Fe-S cluster assembly protein SufD
MGKLTYGPGTLIVKSGMKYVRTFVLAPSSGESSGVGALPFDHIVIEDNAFADICIVIFPGVSADIALPVDFTGEGSELFLSGTYVSSGSDKVGLSFDVHHRMPGCKSNQIFNGIASGRSVVTFSGKIIVAPDAQKTDAYQVNRNILLSEEAKVNTKPQLEIYADDVKCSHGATIGRLDEDAQFYMRSRGIPLDEAKVLQMLSFISPVMEHISDAGERASVAESLESAVRSVI